MLRKSMSMMLALGVATASFAAGTQPAQAQWRRYGGYGGGYYPHYYHRGPGPGAFVGGALLGLGVGALLAAPYVAPRPVYAAPVYAPPPVYYPPPPVYYAPPAYYPPY